MAHAAFEKGQVIGRQLGDRMLAPDQGDAVEFRRGLAAGIEEAFGRAGMTGHVEAAWPAAPPLPESFQIGDHE